MPVAPPRPKGPALNALRAFEVAARLGSFAAASEELSVTPGAIAQHIKSLEAWAGAGLFVRHSKGVELTALGAGLLPAFTTAFDRLGEAVQSLRAQAAPKQVRIATIPSIAQLWLSPRLQALRSAAPDVTISVFAVETLPNLRREPFDLTIFIEDLPGDPDAIEICKEVIFPVCAPHLAARLREPADLAGMTFLHDASWSDDWNRWMRTACPAKSIDTSGPVYSLYSLAVEEAKNGAGVLIAHESLLQPYLDSGALVAPFDGRVPLNRRLSVNLAPTNTSKHVLQPILDALISSG
jgi:LysR family glycine cleavage system transcriptional activator